MDNEMNEWLEDSVSQKIAIWCEDPEFHNEKIVGGMMEKEYVTYRILMKQVGRDIVGVRHRYSEFEALRNSLKEQYGHLGIAVPSLPPKTLLMSSTLKESFLRERTLGLSIFCELIVASVWLRNDRKWMEFMNPNSMGGVDRTNIGETRLCACLMKLELPYKNSIVQKVDEVKQEMLSIEKYAKFMLEKARNLQASERAYSTAQEVMSEAFTLWNKNEQTTSSSKKIFGGRVFEDSHPVLNDHLEAPLQTLSHLTNFVKATMVCNEHRHDYTGLSLVMIMEQELAMVESVKDLLRVHEEMLQFIDSMKGKISKTEASRSANRFEQAAEQRKILEGRQNGLVAFYKGFLFFTVPLTVRQRAASFRRYSAVHAASQLTIAYSLQLACVQFFKDLSMRPSSVINDTCGMLELLRLKRLAQIPPLPEDSTSTTSAGDSVLVDYRLCPSSIGMTGLYRRAFAVSPPDAGSIRDVGVVGAIIPATTNTTITRKGINSSDNVATTGVYYQPSVVASVSVDSNRVAVKHSDGSAGHDTSLMAEMDEAPEDFDSSDPQQVVAVAPSNSSSSSTTYSSPSEESPSTSPISSSSSSSSSSSNHTTTATTAPTTIVVSEKTQQLLAELTESVYNRPATAAVVKNVWE